MQARLMWRCEFKFTKRYISEIKLKHIEVECWSDNTTPERKPKDMNAQNRLKTKSKNCKLNIL